MSIGGTRGAPDPVVFETGEYRVETSAGPVAVHVLEDVRLSDLKPALSRIARRGKEVVPDGGTAA